MNSIVSQKYNSEISEFMDILADVISDYVSPNAKCIDQTCNFPKESLDALAKEGFFGLIIPKELGGYGGSPTLYKDVVIELAKACASTAMIYVQHTSAVSIMLYGAHQPYLRELLEKIAKGGCLATIALSEPESGVYLFLPVSKATLQDDGSFLLSAKKSMVTSAGKADLYVVNSRSTTSKNSMHSNFYVVTKEQKGIYFGETPYLMGLRGNNSAQIEMKNCRIESKALIGNEGDGFKISREKLLPMGQLGVSALQVGIAKAIYQESVQYVKNRFYSHNEKNLSSFQRIQQMMAEMKIECDRAERSLEHMAYQMENGKLDSITMLEIKIIACEAVQKVADLCLKVCGGHAYSDRTPLERYIRDSKAGTVLGPTPEVLKELIGKIILDIPASI